MLTNEEMESICRPSVYYLPFGWVVAAIAQVAKANVTAAHAAQTMVQLAVSMIFLAIGVKS